MKIEIGESLIYSWLRHVNECQIVQCNWKASPNWKLNYLDELQTVKQESETFFKDKYGYEIYKETSSLDQLLRQAEIDALGIKINKDSLDVYCVDIAYHEFGLRYGSSKDETLARIVKKYIRSALCVVGYFGIKKGEIIFASPKIGKAILQNLDEIVLDITNILNRSGWEFKIDVIYNDTFNTKLIIPTTGYADKIADTAELFLRSIQLSHMFSTNDVSRVTVAKSTRKQKAERRELPNDDPFRQQKIGKIANGLLRSILESEKIDEYELTRLQDAEYSKKVFDIQYPLLKKVEGDYDKRILHYYKQPILIKGTMYLLCSEWFESQQNNDRPFLLKWIDEHKSSV